MLVRNKRPVMPKIKHPTLETLTKQGRVQLYAISIGQGTIVHVYQVYGVTNGNGDKQASCITNSILGHICQNLWLGF